MNKTSLAVFLLLLSIGILSALNNADTERKNQCTMANIEALSNDNENPKEFWCCGTSGICVEASNAVILGNLSEKPCY